jgi:general secretion pathway protein K
MWTTERRARGRRGSALLAVLWLSAALAAIAFALSTTVRGETERTATALDGLRAYYLASGAVERATAELLWSITSPDKRKIPVGARVASYAFPSGAADVEIIPEAAKLDVNRASPEQLYRLMVALGIDEERSRNLAAEIAQARIPSLAGLSGPDNLSPGSSFSRPGASFQEIEELLLLKGITPDIFYGTYTPAAEREGGPRLVRSGGLADCLTVFDSGASVDANMAAPAVLAAVGLSPLAVTALVEQRRQAPLTPAQLGEFGGNLRVGGNSIVTLRATARLRLPNGQYSDLRRTVAAQVKFMPDGFDAPIHVLRWYDAAWSE